MSQHVCTVRYAVTGICGKPAVHTFTGTRDEIFGECAEHFDPRSHTPIEVGTKVGDEVIVKRHGKGYIGTVTQVTSNGVVYAEVTYGNGVTRVVRV